MSTNLYDLIRAARDGDRAAREELLQTLRPQLRQWAADALNARYGGRFDASDLVQITLLDLHGKLQDFAGESEGEFVEWLRRMLHRNLVDAVRHATAKKRSIELEEGTDGVDAIGKLARNELAADHSTPSMRAQREEESQQLTEALAKLPPDQQFVVRLVHLEGNSLAQAAEQLNRSTGAVAKLLQRGIKNLRAELGGK